MRALKTLTDDEIIRLRHEVTAGSLFIRDYGNSLGVDPHEACDFFDGFYEAIEWDMGRDDSDCLVEYFSDYYKPSR